MCGIAGFAGFQVRPEQDRAILERMTARLRHRGPDDSGFLVGERAALGMRRLSIIDLEGGRQPITNEDGALAIVFNGEIYNHAELRERLLAKGHRFKTRSDTEVILHLYEDEGVRTPEFLNGMFAFAIADLRGGGLFLARDRFGEKPLYFFNHAQGVVFASEHRALSEHPACPQDVDSLSLALFLRHGFVPTPATLIKGVYQLEPGTCATVDSGSMKTSVYWSITENHSKDGEPLAMDSLDALFTEAVRSRMVSDVPVGAFLSGGMDSSLVASRMALLQRSPIKAFCIGFEEKTFDESAHARVVAKTLGIDLEVFTLTEREIAGSISGILASMDLPIADPSFVPTYFVSRLAASWGKVVLSGDGGDELFGGYPTCQAHVWADRMPAAAMKLSRRMASFLPVRATNFSLRFRMERFGAGAGLDWASRHVEWMSSFTEHEVRQLAGGSSALENDTVLAWIRGLPAKEGLNNVLFADQRFYLGENLLAKVDRASMANSLEVRAPLLDHRLAERANSAPWQSKWNGRQGKLPLRALAQKVLPASITRRAKKGFGIPAALWLQRRWRPLAEEFFSRKALCDSGLVDPDIALRLWKEHLEGRADHGKRLWTLLALLAWRRPAARPDV